MAETEIRICNKHGETEFVKESNNKWRCKKCRAEAVQKRREVLKRKAVDYLGGKCCICGYNNYIGSLDFHHINPSEKDFGISESGITRSWEDIKKELDKCILVCANHHREIHGGLIDIHNYIINKQIVDKEEVKTSQSNTCKKCGKTIDKYSTYCNECAGIVRRKVEWPNREELKQLIRIKSFSEIGRDYGVEGNSVKKWCKSYSLPTLKSEINKISDEDWTNI